MTWLWLVDMYNGDELLLSTYIEAKTESEAELIALAKNKELIKDLDLSIYTELME